MFNNFHALLQQTNQKPCIRKKTKNFLQKKSPAEKFKTFSFPTENFGAFKNRKIANFIYPHENKEKGLGKSTKKIKNYVPGK